MRANSCMHGNVQKYIINRKFEFQIHIYKIEPVARMKKIYQRFTSHKSIILYI